MSFFKRLANAYVSGYTEGFCNPRRGEFLAIGDILQLQGYSAEEIARAEREIARANLWFGRLRILWCRIFPPASWCYTCARCGARTADPGDAQYGLPSYCSRPKCMNAAADYFEQVTMASIKGERKNSV